MAELNLKDLEERFDALKQRRGGLSEGLPEGGKVFAKHVAELEQILTETTQFNEDLRAFTAPDLEGLRKLMGTNLIGPDLWERIGITSVGDPPPFPGALTDVLLDSECRLGGGKVKDTNRLVYVPAGASIIDLAEKANGWCKANRLEPAFRSGRLWLKRQDFAKKEQAEGSWVLMPLELVPGSKGLNDQQQEAHMQIAFPEYETPDALAASCALIGEFIQTGTRTWPNEYGRCQSNVLLGFFDAGGLVANQHDLVARRYDVARHLVGRAACRKLRA